MKYSGGLGPDGSTKKISRVESLKNLILHGKIEPDLPPDVFNYPYCSCRCVSQICTHLSSFSLTFETLYIIIKRLSQYLQTRTRGPRSRQTSKVQVTGASEGHDLHGIQPRLRRVSPGRLQAEAAQLLPREPQPNICPG